MKKINLVAIILFSVLFNYCGKQEVQNPVPNISFSVTLNLTLPIYAPLKDQVGVIVFYNGVNAGSKGLAIMRIGYDQGNEFAVFDRHCTYKVFEGCKVDVDSANFGSLIDKECCNSKFNMFNAGFPSEGPATIGLKPYKYSYDGNNVLRIFN